MYKIVRARLKPMGGQATEFISVKGRIKGLIERNKGDIFHFVIDEGGVKTVKEFGPENINPELVGKVIPIVDKAHFAKFNEDGTIDVTTETNESLPRQQTVNQLNKLKREIHRTTNITINNVYIFSLLAISDIDNISRDTEYSKVYKLSLMVICRDTALIS